MLQIHKSAIHRILVACVVLIEAILPCYNLKSDDYNLATATFSVTENTHTKKALELIRLE